MSIARSIQVVKLVEVADYKTGKLNSNAAVDGGMYPFFTCSRETFRTNTWSFDCECVLLAGNNANAEYPVKYFNGKFDAYQRMYVITAKDPRRLNIRFLYYAVELKLNLLKSLSTGVTTRFLTKSILDNLEFDLPTVEIQNQIVDCLAAYDNLIENNNRRIAILEEMAQSLYREWFVKFRFPGYDQSAGEPIGIATSDPEGASATDGTSQNTKFIDSPLGKIPDGWQVKRLFDIASPTYGCAFKSRQFNDAGNGVRVVRIRNIPKNWSNTFTEEEPKKGEQILKNGDLLIGMDGDFHMGKWAGGHAYLNQRVIKITANDNYSSYFVFLSMRQPIQNLNKSIVGTTVAHLGDKHLKEVQVVVPPYDLLKDAGDFFDQIFSLELKLRMKNHNLKLQRDGLLPKLVSGAVSIDTVGKTV